MNQFFREPKDLERLLPKVRADLRDRVPERDIQKLAGDIIAMAWENRHEFDPRQHEHLKFGHRLLAWIGVITDYKVLEYYEKRRRMIVFLERICSLGQQMLNELRLPQDALIESSEQIEILNEALEGCSPSLLETAKLFLEGKDYEHIAKELAISLEEVCGRLSRFQKKLDERLRNLKDKSMSMRITYSPKFNLQKATAEISGEHAMPGCQFGDDESLRRFYQFADRLTHLEEQSRECLKKARQEIESGDMSLSDKRYATRELLNLTAELQKNERNIDMLRQHRKFLNEVAPTASELLLSAPELAKLFEG